MQKHLLSAFIVIAILSISLFNNWYSPKSILILSSLSLLFNLHHLKQSFTTNKLVILGLNLSLIISLIFSQNPNLGLNETLMLIASFSLLLNPKYLKEHKSIILNSLAIIILIQFCLSIYQWFNLDYLRSFGTFTDLYNPKIMYPNALALFSIIAFGFISLMPKKWQEPLIYLNFFTLYLSLSRGGLIAGSLVLGCYLLQSFRTNKAQSLRMLCIIIVGIFCLSTFNSGISQNIQDKITFSNSEKLTSLQERLETFNYGVQKIIQNPIIGEGPNTYQAYHQQFQTRWLASSPHPHNFFVKYWSEFGILFMLFFSIFGYQQLKNLRLSPNSNQFISSVTVLAILLHNSIDYNLNFNLNIMLFCILLAFLSKDHQLDSNQQKQLSAPKQFSYKYNYITPIILIIFITTFIQQYSGFRDIRDNFQNPNFAYSNHNFQNSILTQIQHANLHQRTIPTENLDYFVAKSQNQSQNLFELSKYFESKDLQLSQKYISQALQLNPRNNWSYYLQDLVNRNNSKTSLEIQTELQAYQKLAAHNVHYTAQSQNLVDAIQVCKKIQANNCQQLEEIKKQFNP